ncbi:long-chain acyl-CoA synthetase [Mangrovibacterium marinum]|uniref:Long-chain acyl-CoA synthetase n=1 Tax=Mangrovibacterium marinum TaxID=1639118 RepID=A0A2T5BZ16_9BACT|nr:AMP-binding protein [Mangrovibacterium marinum]PTN07504.1 long-chain acyl-CoA synthetase [Mangrovibacterium marinum]
MKTIIELFESSVGKFPDNIYLWEKSTDKFAGTTYRETRTQVLQFAAGLISLGVKKGDRIGLISEGRNQWIISELGILYAGAINVPLSVKLDAQTEMKFRLMHSGCRFVIVSKGQASKIEAIRNELPELEAVIYLNEKEEPLANDLFYCDLVEQGKNLLHENRARVEQRYQAVQPNDLANISYTSGTTADPKGIMLSHLNYAANVLQSSTLMDITPDWKTLAFLPWDHAFAHTACLYCFMYFGASVASLEVGSTPMETLKNIPKNIKEIKPRVLMSVPAIAKNFRKGIESGIRQKGPKAEKLFNHALKIAYKYNGNGFNRGKGLRFIYKPLVALYDKLLFSKIRESFGGELKLFIGGGALLDIELQRFFFAIGIPMCQGYGLSEAAPVISSNALHAIKMGSSGRLVKYMELKIVDAEGLEMPAGEKGEIIVKGDNVMLGYWKNPTATADTLQDGWLHTGDMGYLDQDGFLYVLGRFKSLLIGHDGEKYSPEGIEEAIVEQSPLIDQCMLHNNQDPYTTGLIVPNAAAISRELSRRGIQPGTDRAIESSLKLIQSEIDKYKRNGEFANSFPERWLPATIAILPEAFTEQNHLLNSTMKMVRGKIAERFASELEFVYSAEAKNIVNENNRQAMKQWYDE